MPLDANAMPLDGMRQVVLDESPLIGVELSREQAEEIRRLVKSTNGDKAERLAIAQEKVRS